MVPGGIRPTDRSDFYDRLKPFAALCASYGCYVEFTAFTQTQTLMPNVDDQTRHWQKTQNALRGVPCLLELVNEADQHDNRTDPALLQMRPTGILASSGSNGADKPPPEPVWDYGLYHSNDLDQWWRKVGHNAMEDVADKFRIPAMSNENTRYPDRDSSPDHAFDAAAGAALLCAGSCFHSDGGKLSRLFDDTERRCAAAWVAGAKSVPLEFQHGQYLHRQDLEGQTYLRVYEKRLGDGRSFIVKIRP